MSNLSVDVAVIGGGPAGLAAALEAHKNGCSVMLFERDNVLGGILNQCIHAGFGLHHFKEELTGPEYASRFVEQVDAVLNAQKRARVESGRAETFKLALSTMVLAVSKDKLITAVNPKQGIFKVQAGAVVLCMGCRERTRGAINIAGTRPAGVFSAGTAQRLINLEGKMVGKRVVILGSGDIGLIMARRLTFEGAKVLCVAEIMPYSSGLSRNIVQCLDDLSIPLYYNTTVSNILGKERLTAVELCEVGEDRKPIESTRRVLECDTLLLSVGLIPENELTLGAGISLDRTTGGAVVDQHRQTALEGIFACGNVLHVHDLVDNVTAEGIIAGGAAARYINGALGGETVKTVPLNLVRYVLPQALKTDGGDCTLYFRVQEVVKNPRCVVECNGRVLKTYKKLIMLPGEMESVKISLKDVNGDVSVSVVCDA